MTINNSLNDDEVVLASLLGSRARLAVLRTFCVDPGRAYYQRQLEAATGLPLRAVQRELERFVSVDLVYRRLDGNRAYYRIDPEFPLFEELRALVLKAGDDRDRLRARLAEDDAVRLAFLSEDGARVLVVSVEGRVATPPAAGSLEIDVMTSEAFLRALSEDRAPLEPYLGRGVDLLGGRDDAVWRRIGSAGFTVEKGKGVP